MTLMRESLKENMQQIKLALGSCLAYDVGHVFFSHYLESCVVLCCHHGPRVDCNDGKGRCEC